jgi:hypothetical protein
MAGSVGEVEGASMLQLQQGWVGVCDAGAGIANVPMLTQAGAIG